MFQTLSVQAKPVHLVLIAATSITMYEHLQVAHVHLKSQASCKHKLSQAHYWHSFVPLLQSCCLQQQPFGQLQSEHNNTWGTLIVFGLFSMSQKILDETLRVKTLQVPLGHDLLYKLSPPLPHI